MLIHVEMAQQSRRGCYISQRKMEDFGKRNMPSKCARRHFSQLSEFERGLIFGMKIAGWSTRRVAGQVDRLSVPLEIVGSSGHEKVLTRGKPGLERPGSPRGERLKDRATSPCGPHSDSFNDTSRRRRSICSTNNFQTPCRSKS
ncbi:transposable element Tcb2 transposase [Trichonephila clavipes]|nr:transposable element Tcb2 transposase [Trichonephila clavipes]